MTRPRTGPTPEQPERRGQAPAGPEDPRTHYRRGNRLFERRDWSGAARAWRRADDLWRAAAGGRVRRRDRLAGLQAALLLLATVMGVYLLLYTQFPRDPFEMLMAGLGGQNSRQELSWWEEFLRTGRPGRQQFHKMDIREWWNRFTRNESREAGQRGRQGEAVHPSIDERWAELMRRYGRWGPIQDWGLDYQVVSGYGLTTLGRYDEAVRVLKQGLERTSDPDRLGGLYQGLANAYYFKGYELQPDGLATYDLALMRKSAEAYEKAIEHRPRLLSMGNLGWVYFLLGDYDEAEHYSRRALAIDGSMDYVRLNLGLLYLVQEERDRAFRQYRQVARHHPEDDVFLGGINDLKEIIRDHPGKHPFAHLVIGYLAIHKGEPDQARRHLETFLSSPFTQRRWRHKAQQWLDDPASATGEW